MIRATAPGKAVLAGEYAVLQNAPAVVVALGRSVRVTADHGSGTHHVLSTPGYLEGKWRFRLNDIGDFDWREPLPDAAAFSLVEAVWKSFDTRALPPLSISIDTQEFYDRPGGCKLGLGSSAAVAVALTATLQQFLASVDDVRSVAFDAHDYFQRGRGSGVDIAASFHGGLLEYRREGRHSRPLSWPDDIHCRFLWSGRPTDTRGKLETLNENRSGKSGDSAKALMLAAEDAASEWSSGKSRRILEAMRKYVDMLRRFSTDLDLGIFDAGHEHLVGLAAESGIVYKPCGAGGGDIGVVLANCQNAIDDFCGRATRHGFSDLDIEMDEQGVLTEVSQDVG